MEAVDGSQYPLRLGILIKRSQADGTHQVKHKKKNKKFRVGAPQKANGRLVTHKKENEEQPKRRKKPKKQKQKQKKFPFVRRRSDTSSDATCQQQLPERPKRDVRSRAGRDGDDGERGIEAAGSFRPVFFFFVGALPPGYLLPRSRPQFHYT